jgi:serine phosphatase RsbU (regulator of sigma subunit)
MSMLGISSLEDIVNRRNIIDPAAILNELSIEIRRSLHQNEGAETKDGMDISVCVIDRINDLVSYSGANNNLYLVRNNELIEYKADRIPVGYHDANNKDFSSHDINSFPGDMIYIYSDGYADQFGGLKNKKYKYSALKELLLNIHVFPLPEQKTKFEEEFYAWKGENTQVDDVLIIGYRF